MALLHIGQRQGHCIAILSCEGDGVRLLDRLGPLKQRGHGKASHLGVGTRSAISGIAGAGAAQNRLDRCLVEAFLNGGHKGVANIALYPQGHNAVAVGHRTVERRRPLGHLRHVPMNAAQVLGHALVQDMAQLLVARHGILVPGECAFQIAHRAHVRHALF